MGHCPFCTPDPGPSPGASQRPMSWWRRMGRTIQWLFPAALLVLIPKCPMCVAGYIALGTGIGVSFTTAQWIRWLLVGFCMTALAYLTVRKTLGMWKGRGGRSMMAGIKPE